MGDLDSDGTGDVLVRESGGGSDGTGRIRLFSGALLSGTDKNPEDMEILEWEPEQEGAGTGSALLAGDFDGDGVPDLVITAPSFDFGASSTATAAG